MDCECSEDFGPCEQHCDLLVQRAGASTRTADELALILIEDLAELGVVKLTDDDKAWLVEVWAALERERHLGVAWLNDPDMSQALHDESTRFENNADGVWVIRDDGYTIIRPHDDCPLLAS